MHWTQTEEGKKRMAEIAKAKNAALKGRNPNPGRKPPKYRCTTCGQKFADSSYHKKTRPGHVVVRIDGKLKGKRTRKFVSVVGAPVEQSADQKLAVQVSYAAGYVVSWLHSYADKLQIPRNELIESVSNLLEGGK